MAFAAKTDYCGLVTALGAASVALRDDDPNETNETYRPTGQNGEYVATEVYGDDAAPSNNYAVRAGGFSNKTVVLGTVTTVGTSPDQRVFALESFKVTTAGGSPVAISATSQEVESSATDSGSNHFSCDALTVSSDHVAQILFSAFTLTGTGCHLTACDANASCTVSKDKVAGTKVSSDVTNGQIVVSGTILQTGATEPTVTAAEGWTITRKLTCPNPETVYKSWSFEVTKNLAKTMASSAA